MFFLRKNICIYRMEIILYRKIAKNALEMKQTGIGTQKVLDYLTSEAEKIVGERSVCSILLLDENGLLRNGSSPSLPDDYLQAIDGLKPDKNLGTCASAAATGSIVFTEDFTADTKWAELKHLPMALGFTGAWSMPIKTGDNVVKGTFGTYYRTKRLPETAEIEGLRLLAETVATILAD